MKNLFYLILLLSTLLWGAAMPACQKEASPQPTIITGRVFNIKTGIGLDSIFIHYTEKEADDDDSYTSQQKSAITDSQGHFSIKIPAGLVGLGFYIIQSGYLPKIIKPNPAHTGQTNEIEIGLFPEDSWLRLMLNNGPGYNDSLFFRLKNETIFPGGYGIPTFDFPTVFTQHQTQEEVLVFSGGTYTTIQWAFTRQDYLEHPMIDSVFMPIHDTVSFSIEF